MLDPIRRRIRRAIETVVPWFDRAQADRQHAELRQELAVSRAIRQRAVRVMERDVARDEVMRGSFARAGERLVK